MISYTRFSKAKRQSLLELLERAYYLQNATHDNHVGKLVHPVGVYHADGTSVLDFLEQTLVQLDSYRKSRAGKKGNCTSKVMEEFIHSFEEFGSLTPEESAYTKEQFIREMFANVSVLVGTHEDTILGRVDLHFLPLPYTNHQPPRLFDCDGFGHGKKHILLEFERVEARILKVINKGREPHRQIQSARQKKELLMAKRGIKSIGRQLAGKWDGRRRTLRRALALIGYYLIEKTKKMVIFRRDACSKKLVRNIATLNAQRLLEVERLQAEAADSDGRKGVGSSGSATCPAPAAEPAVETATAIQAIAPPSTAMKTIAIVTSSSEEMAASAMKRSPEAKVLPVKATPGKGRKHRDVGGPEV